LQGILMNWYYNNAGAAEGPLDDQAMAELVHSQKLASDSLVWHAGLEAWQSVAVLSPSWWAASLPTPAGRPVPVTARKPVKETSDSGARRLSGPNAPTSEAVETKPSVGFLKRLFGFGRKKG
jgi:hypothetical protein